MNRGGNMISIFSVLSCLYFLANASKINNISNGDSGNVFPSDFSFGVATAAYQIEGGWNADGKGPSIWDTFTHQYPELIADGSNGDVGPNSYELFDLDLQALKELSVNHYRFSISWARVLPNGDTSIVNQAGCDYYNMIINKLLENNITPMVTMIHYDLPQEIQKIGGFVNPLFVNYFLVYADFLYSKFGDRVKHWITFNEAADFCVPGYGDDVYPPRANATGIGEYLCMHHVLKAHALAYDFYKKGGYAAKQNGKVGITFSSRFFYSRNNDADLIDRAIQFSIGWGTHAIFSQNGGYPEVMIEDIESASIREGRKWSRLPNFDDSWTRLIQGSSDFLGLNYYTSRFVDWADPPEGVKPSIEHDSRMKYGIDSKWKRGKSTWLYSVPQGLGDLLRWFRDNYNNVEVMITENGWSSDGELDDDDRIDYVKEHLNAVADAIKDGCNVTAYTVWSLIDNFEWTKGYTEKFGLYAVDMDSPTKQRVPRKSAAAYKQIITTRNLN